MNTTSDYLKIIDNFEATPILCVGDVMLDRFVQGSVDRISPEAPIPVLHVKHETSMPGGAGNVVANLAALGAAAFFTSAVGDDAAGHELRQLVASHDREETLLVDDSRPTTIKTRFVSGGQQLLRVDHEVSLPISDTTEARLIAHALALIPEVKAVVISDYRKGVITKKLAQAVIVAATKAGIPVVVDSKPGGYEFFAGAKLLKPNRGELARATGMPVGTDDEIVAASRRLIELSGVDCIVATRSEQGMSVIPRTGDAIHFRTEAKEVFDVSGAGDTVAATIALALGSGASLIEAVELANHAAGIAVSKIGTAAVRLSELREVLREQDDIVRHKFQSLEDVTDQVERWRARDVRVGFTNGCFDILHPGHISLIAQARRACDRLIIGLNSDASVKRLKGESRPVNDEHARAAVLSALEDVDAVVVFGEDTPKNIIEHLRPDVLVKGADYTLDKVVGADFVMSYGGKVVLAELKAGHSTTNTIARMAKKD